MLTDTYVKMPGYSIVEAPKSFGKDEIKNYDLNKIKDCIDIFSIGLNVLYLNLTVLSHIGNSYFKEMQARSKYAGDILGKSNQVDEVIAKAATGDDKTKELLPDKIIDFMRKNGITVDDMSIDEYLKEHGPELNKGQLQAVKGALDNERSRTMDTMSQDQLQLQKTMQSYNVCANNISTLQSGLKDLLMTITRNFC